MSNGMGALKARSCPDDRRGAYRYKLNWEVRVISRDRLARASEVSATLQDLSCTGALTYLKTGLRLGERVLVVIKLPLQRESWMSYWATVVRVDEQGNYARIALKFDTSRPEFTSIPVDSFQLGTSLVS
jgi:c-di-GMP-binding flagellar brake protein YcgR